MRISKESYQVKAGEIFCNIYRIVWLEVDPKIRARFRNRDTERASDVFSGIIILSLRICK